MRHQVGEVEEHSPPLGVVSRQLQSVNKSLIYISHKTEQELLNTFDKSVF